MQKGTEKEWYYGNKERERLGPFSFKEVSTSICKIMKNLFAALPCKALSSLTTHAQAQA